MMTDQETPYGAIPAAFKNSLATPGRRMAAVAINHILLVACFIPFFTYTELRLLFDPLYGAYGMATGQIVSGILGLLLLITLLLWQVYLLGKTGQSVGKKWLGIGLRSIHGRPPSFWKNVVLREWLFYFLAMIATSFNTMFFVPTYGQASSTHIQIGYYVNYDVYASFASNLFVNVAHNWPYVLCALMLFRKTPQTLQDYLADTAVVNVAHEARPPTV